MKKFLVGIVTLVAAVMLTSPAFGAIVFESGLTGDPTHKGFFEFNMELAADPVKLDVGTGPGFLEVSSLWGATQPLIDPYMHEGIGNLGGDSEAKSGYAFFNPGVEIIVVQWDGLQYGFLFEGYVTEMSWTELRWAVSHVDGYNQVPVPAAVWLLGSGVLGLVAVRRRRS